MVLLQMLHDNAVNKHVPDDWFTEDKQSEVIDFQGDTQVYSMDKKPVDVSMSSSSCQSCGDFNSGAARIIFN